MEWDSAKRFRGILGTLRVRMSRADECGVCDYPTRQELTASTWKQSTEPVPGRGSILAYRP